MSRIAAAAVTAILVVGCGAGTGGALPPEPLAGGHRPGCLAHAAARRALDRLAASQRENGTWPSPLSFGEARRLRQGCGTEEADHRIEEIRMVTAAAAGLAFVASDRPTDAASRARAESFLAGKIRGRGAGWHSNWALAFTTMFFAADAGDDPARRELLTVCIDAIARRQLPDGGWGYRTPGATARPCRHDVTAVTMVMAEALARARGGGARIPEGTVARLDALLGSLTLPNGRLRYSIIETVVPETAGAETGTDDPVGEGVRLTPGMLHAARRLGIGIPPAWEDRAARDAPAILDRFLPWVYPIHTLAVIGGGRAVEGDAIGDAAGRWLVGVLSAQGEDAIFGRPDGRDPLRDDHYMATAFTAWFLMEHPGPCRERT